MFDREDPGDRVYRTQHRVPIVLRRKPGPPLLHAGNYTIGGASEEPPERAGVTTLLVRTALKGTASRSALQIAEEGEMLGGSVGGIAGSESFGWSISVPTRFAAAAIELLADVVQHPTIADDKLETERSVAISDIIALRPAFARCTAWCSPTIPTAS